MLALFEIRGHAFIWNHGDPPPLDASPPADSLTRVCGWDPFFSTGLRDAALLDSHSGPLPPHNSRPLLPKPWRASSQSSCAQFWWWEQLPRVSGELGSTSTVCVRPMIVYMYDPAHSQKGGAPALAGCRVPSRTVRTAASVSIPAPSPEPRAMWRACCHARRCFP
jgi:hypothetical protein